MFTIEKNIPLPHKYRKPIGHIYEKIVETLNEMEAVDSFIAFTSSQGYKSPEIFRTTIRNCLKARGAENFVIGITTEGFRIWKS
jgi:hypothetical protein